MDGGEENGWEIGGGEEGVMKCFGAMRFLQGAM